MAVALFSGDKNMRKFFVGKLKGVLYFQAILLLAGNYSPLYQRDLFNLTPPPPPPKVEVKPIIREPLLSEILVLKGTVVGAGLSSLAVIENRQAGSENIYQEGARVAGALIVRIELDRVNLLDKEDKEVVLALSSAGGVPPGPGVKQAIIETDQAVPVATQYIPDTEVPATSISLADITRQVVQNPAEIRDLMVAPVVSEGKVAGYRVQNIAAGSLADRYGIKNGDVVTRVNGIVLEKLSQVNEIYRSIKPGTPFAVEILRAGNPLTLSFQFTP
ncbi:MAG: PDZ domain-containing protein [Candidatus Omnitrophota bacterium]